jgi:hypothetical protein
MTAAAASNEPALTSFVTGHFSLSTTVPPKPSPKSVVAKSVASIRAAVGRASCRPAQAMPPLSRWLSDG